MKKYNGTAWVDTTLRQYKAATDTVTILPVDIYADGNTATVGLKGNTVQSSIPSPTSPIMPQGTGEKTRNLAQWEKGGISATTGADESYRTAEQGGTCEQLRSLYIPCYGNADYVLHTNHYPVQTFISYYDADKNYISRSSGNTQGENRVFTTPETARYMRAQLAHATTGQIYPAIEENQQYAITFGSTALPYEPYGYKIPISSANTTTPVYLGEVETTRKIRKLVLTGYENWYKSNTYIGSHFAYLSSVLPDAKPNQFPYCSHLGHNSGSYSYGNCRIDNNALSLWMFDTNTSADDFKSYLAAQYAADTPVTVWCVLATPETAVVNEPLMRIDNYADTVSGITIPTIIGKDSFDVNTTLKPSEASLSYTGWHDATVEEWDGNQWG